MYRLRLITEAGATKKQPPVQQPAQQDPTSGLTPIQKSNYQFILKRPSAEDAFRGLAIRQSEWQDSVIQIIKKIPQLSKFKLLKVIAHKSYGKVFKLSNRHVLKIFADSLDVDRDMQWYKDSLDALHTGKANVRTLPVVDFGKCMLSAGTSVPGRTIDGEVYYVELAEIIPLKKWIQNTGRDPKYLDFQFDCIVDAFLYSRSPYLKFNVEKLISQMRDYGEQSQAGTMVKNMVLSYTKGGLVGDTVLTKAEFLSILKALYEMDKYGADLDDVFPRNIGLLPTSRPDKPVFTIFDI